MLPKMLVDELGENVEPGKGGGRGGLPLKVPVELPNV
jgi:hypothetical protein